MKIEELLFENVNTRLKKALIGAEPNILSFAIGTVENPMGNDLPNKDNLKLRKEFEKLLSDGSYKFTHIVGQYGNKEHSYIIYNVPLGWCKKVFKEYDQEAFIWVRCKDGKVTYEWWQKSKDGDYSMGLTQNHIDTVTEAKDFFSRLKDYKFLISFNFDEQLDEDFSDIDNYTLEDISYMNNYVDGKFSGYNNYMHHKQIQSRIKK